MSFNPSAALACSSLPVPSLFGAEILFFQANQVTNYTRTISMGLYMNHGAVDIQAASFCNVSIAYTHPGLNDTVNAGLNYVALAGMPAAMGEDYVSLSTDAGLGTSDSATWGLLSPGNPNRNLLQNHASTSLNDLAIIGKDITNKYYGTPPVYSYWTGCSQGGRQGMMLAQRFPEAFDGIAASSPAINWSGIFVGDLWAHVIMNTINIYPHTCEMQAITAAAIKACDANDGLVDGIIADPDSCNFDPTSLAMWDGPRKSDNSSLFFGQKIGTVLSSDDLSAGGSLALTTCSSNGTLYSRSTISSTPVDSEEFDQLYHSSVNEWSSIIGTNDPDLSQFRARRGKLLTYHGLADGIIPPNSTTSYYDSVTALNPNVHNFYRVFMAPGVAHCLGGPGAFPADTFDTMRAWVENGTVPDIMDSTFFSNTAIKRTICPYSLKQTYDGVGNATANEGFSCQ
ncbi:uncharacterized protein EAF02_011223 [Botrytis sinoallii]|uniref:uncharacterized protein n=1 Tax=Botrytis sinoallii TaxID=1463999 RepID=UPI0018FF8CCC|nr:uncharacterized protein EAF02_011223 [Botrytis sinoallii]KAF7857856.1 hypothetical protein EAF02_011223 [Botrytis sinoallii]